MSQNYKDNESDQDDFNLSEKEKISRFISILSDKQKEDSLLEKEKISKFLKNFLKEEEEKNKESKKSITAFVSSLQKKQKEDDFMQKEKISIFLKDSLKQEEENKKKQEEKRKKESETINNFISSLDKKQKENQSLEKEKISKFLKDFLQEEKDKKQKELKEFEIFSLNIIEKDKQDKQAKIDDKKKAEDFLSKLSKEEREKEIIERKRINEFIKNLYKKQKDNDAKEKDKLNKFLKDFLNKEKEDKRKELDNINSFLKTLSTRSFLSEEQIKEENKKLVEKITNFLRSLPNPVIIKPENIPDIYIKGTNVGAPIVPGSEVDTYPTHNEKYGLGGYRSVANKAERDSIPMQRRKAGMVVRTIDTGADWILDEDLLTWLPRTINTSDINNLDDYLSSKADINSPTLFGEVNVSGRLNTIYANVNGSLNTGAILLPGSFSTGKISIRSKIINFKIQAETQIFIVPAGYMFLIDSMEVITTSIISPRNSPTIRFGYSNANSGLYGPKKIVGNYKGSRHIIENPQTGIIEGNKITFGVTIPSSATHHNGVGVINGYLLKTSDAEYMDVPPLVPPYPVGPCEQLLGTVISCNKNVGQWTTELNNLGWSNIRYEQDVSEFCNTCPSITFYGTCCNTCESNNNPPTSIPYSDCYGATSLTLWNCCS
jgi:hypothetical protein